MAVDVPRGGAHSCPTRHHAVANQRPKDDPGQVESRDTLNSIALKFDTTPNELVTLNKLFSRAVVPGKVLYVPDPDFVSNAESSPSMSPISPPSPSPSEPDLLQVSYRVSPVNPPAANSRLVLLNAWGLHPFGVLNAHPNNRRGDYLHYIEVTQNKGAVGGVLLLTPTTIMFDPLGEQRGCDLQVMSVAMCTEVTDPGVRGHLPDDVEDSGLQANESSSSAAASLSKDVFSESEVSLLQDNDVKPSQHAMGLPAYLGQRYRLGAHHLHTISPQGEEEEEEEEEGEEQEQEEEGEARRRRGVRLLCVRLSRPMMKTFVSPSSAAMQRYAQQHRHTHTHTHLYRFTVPADRSDALLSFFIHWSPDTEEGGAGPSRRRAGFVVVKKKQEVEPGSERPPVHDITSKDWEVVSAAEYQRRVDALHSADLQALCRRLQISTRPGAAARSDLESEPLSPTLSEPSRLLTPERILQLVKHLPPRTIGYPWTLAFSTANHGSSIKTLYRNMAGLDTPTLMVLKDGDGQVFGALASEPLRVSDCFYGTGETFLFSFCPELQWTGDNMFFLKGDTDSLTFGGGGGFGLWLDGDLYHGRSSTCGTFGNPRLTQREDFVLQDIEVWAFH
uniref:Oxidation resistance protein 1 n=1 Tax=Myripristis murdjan TaxID=586833 RepID=A0A667XHN0_9TELE